MYIFSLIAQLINYKLYDISIFIVNISQFLVLYYIYKKIITQVYKYKPIWFL